MQMTATLSSVLSTAALCRRCSRLSLPLLYRVLLFSVPAGSQIPGIFPVAKYLGARSAPKYFTEIEIRLCAADFGKFAIPLARSRLTIRVKAS